MELSVDTIESMTGRSAPLRTLEDRSPAAEDVPADGERAEGGSRAWGAPERLTQASLLLGDAAGAGLLYGGTHALVAWVAPEAAAHVPFVFQLFVPLLAAALGLSGCYRARIVHPAVEMKRMARVTALVSGTVVLTAYAVAGRADVAGLAAVVGLLGTVGLPGARGAARVFFSRWPWWGVSTVIVSSPKQRRTLLRTFETWPEIGIHPVAALDASGPSPNGSSSASISVSHLAQACDAPCAVLSFPDLSHASRARLLTAFSEKFDHVFTVDDVDAPALWSTGERRRGLRSYAVGNAATRLGMRLIKRTVDVLGAALALLLVAPLFLTIAALIRLDSDGPVFYRQERMGLHGQPFTVLKFRSMYPDADERLEAVLAADPERRREYARYHKLKDDPRVTRVGRILREYSLDELPQLLNVLRGEMSLVGPRAYLASERKKMKGLAPVVLQTPPGITGLWQVSGRNQLPFEERVDLDVHYVQNWSLWLDFYILLRTIPTVLTGEGAA